jgi:cell division protease FtsH
LKHFKGLTFYIILLIIILFILSILWSDTAPGVMKYSDLIYQLENNNVESIVINSTYADVKLFSPGPDGNLEYVVNFGSIENFSTMLDSYYKSEGGFSYFYAPEKTAPWWLSLISPLILIVLFVLFWVFFIQQAQGGGGSKVMSFGKSRARLMSDEDKKKTFEDVAGAEEEKEELAEIVEFLKHPSKFIDVGARIPKGVLLVGPPGTGKTLLAKAVAGEAGVPFYTISGSDFVEMFVGVGASRVRDLFDQAKKNSPCIVFIDEIDAVGRHRGAGLGGGHDEREQTLNQLLVEMDGFGVNQGVIVLAATNRPDILDPALLRPGRFDRRIYVGMPDIKGREAILRVHARKKPLMPEVDLGEIAKITPGFTGADLENLMNEAAILSARKNKKEIGNAEIKEAIFKVQIGPEKKSRVISEHERKLTAYHEAGHAIAVRAASTFNKVDRVTIIPAGAAGGYTVFKPDEDKSFYTKSQLMEGIIVALGGRAAEEVVLGEISTGAGNDLQQANKIARSMIVKFGMSERLSNLVFNGEESEVFIGRDFGHIRNYSDEYAAMIDEEVKAIIDNAYSKTVQIMKENINKLKVIAETLLQKEKIGSTCKIGTGRRKLCNQ